MKRQFMVFVFVLMFSCLGLSQSDASKTSTEEGYFSGADGVRLFYRKIGQGKKTVVLLHGGPGSNMNAVFPDFEPLAKNYTVLMYDQRGGGRSELIKDPSLLTAAHHVHDLETLRKHFKLKQIIIIGESWGAGLAALYAAKYPNRVKRLLFLGPMPPTKNFYRQRFDKVNETTEFYRRLAEYRRVLPTADNPVALCREFFAIYLKPYFFDQSAMNRRRGSSCDAPPDAVRNYILVNDATMASLKDYDFFPILAQIRKPAFVVEGEQSTTTVEGVRAWAKTLPNARLLLVPNAGHYPQVEQPDVFFPAAREFLDGGFPKSAIIVKP